MDYFIFSWFDYTLFLIMMGLSMAIGIYYGCFGSKQSSTSEYFHGGGKMNIIPVSMSLITNGLSGVSLLGIPVEMYIHGTQYSITLFSLVIMGIITNYVYLPVFYELKLKSTYEYFQLRFDKHVQNIASFLFIVMAIFESPMIIYAPSLAFNQMSGFNLYIIASSVSLICIFYTSLGGFKAVIWTDALQLSVTLFTLFFTVIMGVISVGGFGYIWEQAEFGERIEFFNMNPDPTIRTTFWSIIFGQIFFWIGLSGINPAAVQRFVSVPTLNDSKKVLLIFVIATILTKTVNFIMGLMIYAEYYDCDPYSAGLIKHPDQISSYYVLNLVHEIPGISGLFVACLFSVALSSFSTRLNVLSGTIFIDYIAPFMSAESASRRGSIIMKIITVIIGIVSVLLIFVVERLGTMVEFMITINGIVAGILIGLFTLGMLFPIANSKGALGGGILSLILMCSIGFKKQILLWNGELKYPTKPFYTYGCNTTTVFNTTTPSLRVPMEEPAWLFRITYLYYGLIGAISTIIIGLLISLFTKSKDIPIKRELFSPFIRRFIPQYTRGVRSNSIDQVMYRFNTDTKKPRDE